MNSYARIQKATLSGRSLEREVFTRINVRLAGADPSEIGGLSARAEALMENRRLWETLALDLSSENNLCTPELKAGLLGLAMFVERHTELVINDEASVDVLVEINRNIIRGLSGDAAVEAA